MQAPFFGLRWRPGDSRVVWCIELELCDADRVVSSDGRSLASPVVADRIGPPDFVGVGSQRCGTTWWFRTLLHHPQIRPPRGRTKELHFFDRFCAAEMRDADVAGYHERFPRGPGQIAGEWTPRYMGDVWTPRLLRRAAPEARLLVLVRDPIERYRSAIVHRRTSEPPRPPELVSSDAVERGRYAAHLTRLHAHFDPAQILVLQYERCRIDGPEQYRRTLRFLGVDDGHEPEGLERPRGTTTEAQKEPLWPDLEQALRAVLEPDVARLAQIVPDLDVGLWPNFAHLAAGGATARA